jgi:hypothetical protein
MSINDLIALLQNRIAFIASQRDAAVERGDIAQVYLLDTDKITTQSTLETLKAVSIG